MIQLEYPRRNIGVSWVHDATELYVPTDTGNVLYRAVSIMVFFVLIVLWRTRFSGNNPQIGYHALQALSRVRILRDVYNTMDSA